MLNWLKSLFNPKKVAGAVIDSLDVFVPFLTLEIERIKSKFTAMDSTEKAQWFVDNVQGWLRRRFGLPQENA